MQIGSPLSVGGNVQALIGYAVKDGVARPYGQAPVDERAVVFHDMRELADPPTLEREGFAIVTAPTSVDNFDDHDQIVGIYFLEIAAVVARMTGASSIFMQPNYVLRGDDRDVSFKERVATMKSHGTVHSDYYETETAEAMARMSMSAAGVTERPKGRLIGINTWRPLSAPPQDRPLALLDRRTLNVDDYVPARIGAGAGGLNALQSRYNPAHRFCWWSNMSTDELLVFLQYEEGYGDTSTVMHAAFSDPDCPAGSPPRQSIEARAYVFIED